MDSSVVVLLIFFCFAAFQWILLRNFNQSFARTHIRSLVNTNNIYWRRKQHNTKAAAATTMFSNFFLFACVEVFHYDVMVAFAFCNFMFIFGWDEIEKVSERELSWKQKVHESTHTPHHLISHCVYKWISKRQMCGKSKAFTLNTWRGPDDNNNNDDDA